MTSFLQIIQNELNKLINIMTLGFLLLFIFFTVIDFLMMNDLQEYALSFSEGEFIISVNIGFSLVYFQIFLLYISSTILGKEKQLKTITLLYGDFKSRTKVNLSKIVTVAVFSTFFSFINVLIGVIVFHLHHIPINWRAIIHSFITIDSVYILFSLVILSVSFLFMSFNWGQTVSFFITFFFIIILGGLITGSINAGDLKADGVVARYFLFYRLYTGFTYLHYSLSDYVLLLLMAVILLSYSLYRLEKIDIQ